MGAATVRKSFHLALVFFLLPAGVGLLQAATAQEGEVRIATYNVENYLTMPRRVGGHFRTSAGKPESEKQAVVRMIAEVRPDVLGLMEIGDGRDLEDLRRRLRAAGIDFPHAEFLEAADSTRRIALLSRYPIVERRSQENLPLWVDGMMLHSPRGILDVTLEPRSGYRIRLLCLHLKSKLEVAEYNEGKLREAEAREVRRRIRDILRSEPATRLIVMGDLNETKNGESFRQITGKPEWPDSLRPLPLSDDRGERWTHHWGSADIYSRIDYILVSRRLEEDIDSARSGIARPPYWREASDHCPVFVSIKPPAS